MFKWTLTNITTGDVYVLQRDPKGWQDLNLVHNRSEKYDGIFYDFSVELAFGCKGSGKEFVDNAYDSLGSEANVTLLLQYACSPVGCKTLFNGKLNFSSYKIEYRGKQLHTVVDIEKLGITQQVKNREKTDVDLFALQSIGGEALNPYTYADYILFLHSRIIFLQSQLLLPSPISSDTFTMAPPITMIVGELLRIFHTQAIPAFSDDLPETYSGVDYWIGLTGAGLQSSNITPIHDSTPQNPTLVNSGYNWSINTAGTFNFFTDPANGGQLSIQFVIRKAQSLSDVGDVIYSNTIYSNAAQVGNATQAYNISASGTTLLNPGDKIYVYWLVSFSLTVGGAGAQFIDSSILTDTFDFIINTNSIVPPTEGKTIAIHEAWSRICEGITDTPLAFKSEFFGRTNSQGLSYANNGYGSFTAIIDGLRLRGFTQSANPVLLDGETKKGIITNLEDMYNSCNSIWGIGLGIENLGNGEVVRVEEKTYFYQDTLLLKISNIPNLQMGFNTDRAYSEIELGYEKWKPETGGGLDEPNTIARWIFTKIKSFENKLSLVSKYLAGMYAIETTRRKNVTFNLTEDTPFDDNIFIIALNRNIALLSVAEKDENITVSAELLRPDTAYNLRFNLFSNFDRIMNQFTSGLTKDNPQPINFSYLEGNGGMTFQFNDGHAGDLSGNVVKNVQNTAYQSSLHRRGDPILLPEDYSFSYPLSFSEYVKILDNPYGYIEFSESDSDYKKGYLKTLSYSMKKKMAEFTLMRKFE